MFDCAPLDVIVDPEVSYAQGMNDLCSRFLEILDSEVDTFWSFSCYMEKFSKDFRADGLRRKIGGMTKKKYNFMYKNFFQNICGEMRFPFKRCLLMIHNGSGGLMVV